MYNNVVLSIIVLRRFRCQYLFDRCKPAGSVNLTIQRRLFLHAVVLNSTLQMRRRKTAIFFLALGISLSGLAVALNVRWILLNAREVVLLVIGIVFFALIITGLILNTIFLVREIRRNEQ